MQKLEEFLSRYEHVFDERQFVCPECACRQLLVSSLMCLEHDVGPASKHRDAYFILLVCENCGHRWKLFVDQLTVEKMSGDRFAEA